MKRKSTISIVDALVDPKLFGSQFLELGTWKAWIVLLKAIEGLDLTAAELELFKRCTARDKPPPNGAKEAWIVVGRRGGKSRMIAVEAAYTACFQDFRKYLAPGERAMVLCIARDRDQAKSVFSYIDAMLNAAPAFKQRIIRQTADEIELSNHIVIAVKTSDYRAVRGVTIVRCVADEIAYWDSIGINPDTEILRAIRPAMATIPTAKLLCISSPYARSGTLYEAHKRYYGQDDPDVLIWQAPTSVMNPLLTESYIAGEMEKDPEAGRSEWMAEFREDLEACFTLEAIEACTISGRTDMLPASGLNYSAFTDTASGGGRDKFSVAIGHRKDGVAIVDLVRWWIPPFDPSEVIAECSALLKPYRVQTVIGDGYAGEFPRQHFRAHGIGYEVAEKNRSELYLDLIPALNSKRVELPDIRQLCEELRRLERRRGRSGKDSINHPSSGHDDIANSVAGLVDLLISKSAVSIYARPSGPDATVKNPFSDHRPTGAIELPRTRIPTPLGVGSTGISLGGGRHDTSGDHYQEYVNGVKSYR